MRGRAIKESRSSRYRGVQWDRNGGRWRARLHTDRTRHIGYFADEDEAAMAWDLAVLRYYGETQEGCKKLNFGEESIRRYRQEPSAGPGVMARRGSDGSNAPVMGFRGVVPHDGGKYRAIVLQNRLHVTIGVFATAEEAARAHDRAAIEIHGWGALTNFPISDYSGDANGTELKAQQAQQAQGPTRRPLLRRQGSMPAGAAYEGGTPRTLLRTGSLASMDASAKPSRASSVPNLQVLANGAAAVAQTGWATGLTTPQTLPHRTPFAAASAGMRAPSPVVGLNSAGALGPDTGAIVDRKRMRADNPGSAGPHHQAGTAEAGSQGTVAINGPLELSPEGQTTGQASAVTQTEDGTWRAVLSVDLGKFATQEEATRAFDR